MTSLQAHASRTHLCSYSGVVNHCSKCTAMIQHIKMMLLAFKATFKAFLITIATQLDCWFPLRHGTSDFWLLWSLHIKIMPLSHQRNHNDTSPTIWCVTISKSFKNLQRSTYIVRMSSIRTRSRLTVGAFLHWLQNREAYLMPELRHGFCESSLELRKNWGHTSCSSI